MSDVEGDDAPAAAPASGPMDINTAIQEVLKQALITDGLARGVREASKVRPGPSVLTRGRFECNRPASCTE